MSHQPGQFGLLFRDAIPVSVLAAVEGTTGLRSGSGSATRDRDVRRRPNKSSLLRPNGTSSGVKAFLELMEEVDAVFAAIARSPSRFPL